LLGGLHPVDLLLHLQQDPAGDDDENGDGGDETRPVVDLAVGDVEMHGIALAVNPERLITTSRRSGAGWFTIDAFRPRDALLRAARPRPVRCLRERQPRGGTGVTPG